jgi:hypothetical protein
VRVYVAGPYTNGDTEANVASAIDAADALLLAGHAPFLPHLTHFWHLRHGHQWSEWLALDLVWLEQCEALVRLPGESPGSDREVERARELGIPVFGGVDEFLGSPHLAAPPARLP